MRLIIMISICLVTGLEAKAQNPDSLLLANFTNAVKDQSFEAYTAAKEKFFDHQKLHAIENEVIDQLLPFAQKFRDINFATTLHELKETNEVKNGGCTCGKHHCDKEENKHE